MAQKLVIESTAGLRSRRAIFPHGPTLRFGEPIKRLAVDAQISRDGGLRLVRVLVAAARVLDGFGREAAGETAVVHGSTARLIAGLLRAAELVDLNHA